MKQPIWLMLTQARKSAGLTQEAAAEKMGVRPSTIANVECDSHRRPSFETIARMVETYKMDPRLLFGNDWESATTADTDLTRAIRSLTNDGDIRWQILNAIASLVPTSRSALAATAKQLGVIWLPVA